MFLKFVRKWWHFLLKKLFDIFLQKATFFFVLGVLQTPPWELRPQVPDEFLLHPPSQLVGYRLSLYREVFLNQVRQNLSSNFLRIFSTKSTISQKNKNSINRKIVYSLVSENCASFWTKNQIWPFLRGRGVWMLLTTINSKLIKHN